MGLLSEESKENEMIMERDGKYLPVVDEPRRHTSKSRLLSTGEWCCLPSYFTPVHFIHPSCHIAYVWVELYCHFV